MLKKFFAALFFILFIGAFQSANAAMFRTDFARVISEQDLNNSSTVAIVVKNIKTQKTLYARNEKNMLNTASTLKLLTFASALDTLGEDYKFETAFYIKDNNLYLKLGADPLLTRGDLYSLVEKLKKSANLAKIKYIYIDDSIISPIPYPDGWCVDDFWPAIAPISPYIIDKNTVDVRLILSHDKTSLNIVQNDKYRFSFINNLKISDNTKINMTKDYGDMTNLIALNGEISEDSELSIPVNNPKYLFISRLEDAFGKYSIPYSDKFYFKSVPSGAKKIASVSHSLDEISVPILKYSDNFCAEVLFRVAGNFYAKAHNIAPIPPKSSLGTTNNGILMFKDYYKKAGLNVDEISIVDGSGVSRYNAASPLWLCDALIYLDKNVNIRKYMEGADEGTLSKRLRYLKGSLWAKTGTHYGLSSLLGILTNKRGEDVVFAIIIQSYSKSTSALKGFEDDLVDCIFNL